MKNQALVLVLIGATMLGACGGADIPEPTATPEPPPATATPMPPTPTEDTTYQKLQAYLGDWSGEWRNITYGSSGAAKATFSADMGGTLSLTVDLDGFVFGALDPDPISYTGSYSADGAVIEVTGDPIFGDVTMKVTPDGEIAIIGDSVPIEGIAQCSATGTITPEELFLEYIVTFDTGDSAVGEITLTKEV